MLELRWRPEARADVAAIFGYIAEHNLAAAIRLEAAIAACAERIRRFPQLYRPGRAEGTREAVVHPNYIVIHRVEGDIVEIVRVVHARRQYP